MATNERRALMRHLGLKLVEHAAVEVRTVKDAWSMRREHKVAVLRDLTGKRMVYLGSPTLLEQTYKNYVRPGESDFENELLRAMMLEPGTEVYAYADMALRIEGLFRVGASIRKYEVDEFGQQAYWVLVGGRVRRYEVGTNEYSKVDLTDLEPITFRDVRGTERAQFMWAYAQILLQRDNRRGQQFAQALQQRMTATGYDPVRMQTRPLTRGYVYDFRPRNWGGTVLVEQYLAARKTFKTLGHMIANPNTDPEAFLTAVREFADADDMGNSFRNTFSNAWMRVHPDSGVVQCSCGHLELVDEVVYARGNQTVCRSCLENGIWHFLEDLQEYDRGGYQHDDGLYYSYEEYDEESDDWDDPDRLPGVRRYSTDVRGLLKADASITPSAYGEFLMGIELEVVPNDYPRRASQHTLETLAPGYAILKSDGSLDDGGFEIVTAPRGLKEHVERFKNWAPHSTLRAWDTGCCGMHVHISSQAFTPTTLGKFIEFINSHENDDFIRSIAGRHCSHDEQAMHYCQRDGCKPGNPKYALDAKDSSRYFMVNTTNVTRDEAMRLGLNPDRHAIGRSQNTVELRIFRATLKKARLLAQIEFAHAAVMFCRWSSMRELDQEHFMAWLKGMAGLYPNLAKWYGVRANTDVVEATPKARAGAEL